MSRLGMLYALTEAEVGKLRSMPAEERYEYMLEEIEEELFVFIIGTLNWRQQTIWTNKSKKCREGIKLLR